MTRSPAQVPALDVIYHLGAAAPYVTLVRSQCMYDLSPSTSSLTRPASCSTLAHSTWEIYLYHLLLCMHMTKFQIQYHGNGCDQSKPRCHRRELWSAIASINVPISQVTHIASGNLLRHQASLFASQADKSCTELMTEAVQQWTAKSQKRHISKTRTETCNYLQSYFVFVET